MEIKIFLQFLRDKGLRITSERSVILHKILSLNSHFDPETLYLQIKKKGLKASRASVYRTVNLLSSCGLIQRVRKTEHGSVYENVRGKAHHDHMLCLTCGRVIEFYSEELESIQDNLCREQGFQGTSHNLEIQGYCRKCRKKKP
jgi:Fur family ferric uptake transcriptional regulator